MDSLLLHQSIHAAGRISFSRSGGPGGQNVNKVNTKVILRIALADLAGLSEAEQLRLREQLVPRLAHGRSEGAGDQRAARSAAGAENAGTEGGEIRTGGELVISASEERSQRVNLERAYARAEALIAAAARLPKKRRPTKPSRAARERRLTSKRRQGEKKAGRRFSSGDDG